MRRFLLSGSAVLMLAAAVSADDWPQFLGPARNGVYAGPPLSEAWPAEGPRAAWRKTIGAGFSGPVVVQGRVILFHRLGNEEIVDAIDARTGMAQWRYAYPTSYRDDFGFDEGPRAVPVVAGGIVYTFGAQGQLHAIDLAKGTRIWSVDTMQRFEVPKGFFGAAGSPLVEDGRVLANVGGAKAGIVAFEAKTGKVLWTATDAGASYSSPVGATIGGRRYAIFLTRAGLAGLDPATGQVLFQRAWRARMAASVNAATPVVVGDLIFVSAQYGPGAGVLKLDGAMLTPLWASDEALSNHYATSVHRDGILYGFHGRQEFGQSLRAVDLRTGAVRWSEDRFGAGTVTLAGDRLVILRENGELVLAPASPDGFKPLARARILPGTVRAYPALSDGFLFARNDDTLIAVDVSAPSAVQEPRAVFDRAVADFAAGRVAESAAAFDTLARLVPSAAPELWQRGIALYYAGRFQDCRAQFESHRTVNPNDVENAAWHFLCVARAESADKARGAILPVGPDARVPMRQVYDMFRGTIPPDRVLEAAGPRDSGQFYAQLYVGLYYEALGDRRRALDHITMAAADRYALAGGYMHTVARVHLGLLRSRAESTR
jgi:outer membrane protein assembly factor BamB